MYDAEVVVKGNLSLCKDCLKHVISLEKNNFKKKLVKNELSVAYN